MQPNGDGAGLAKALGWFSIALGLAQLTNPDGVARLIGVDDTTKTRRLMRTLGVREFTSGVGILATERPTGWVWSRVAGDAMDLGLLGRALNTRTADIDGTGNGVERGRTLGATAAVLGVTALDVLCAVQLRRTAGAWDNAIHVQRSLTVDRSVTDVYEFWHNFENLPRFMRHLQSVQVTGPGRSHWKALAPAGMTVEWDAEIVEDRPDELIQWRSAPGADVDNTGTVCFTPAPGNRGTEVHVDLRYAPPAGRVGATVAKLFHEEPGQQIQDDLRAFKQVMEVGEVLLSDATVRRGPHPARPEGVAS